MAQENFLTSIYNSLTRPKKIDLAETVETTKRPTGNRKEIGVGGEQLIRSAGLNLANTYAKEEVRQDKLKIADYRQMFDNDGQIQMLVNAVFNTILSPGVSIVDDESYESEEDSEEKKFIEKNLLAPPWKGGMDIPIELTNRYHLRAFIEGYRIFEVIYRKDGDGKMYLKKLAPRAAEDDFQMKIIVDKNGLFLGYKQRLSFGGEPIDVTVVNDSSIKKVHHVAFGQEFGSLYGRSGLRAAWYHYDKAHKGNYLNHVGHELGVIKPRLIKVKGNPSQTLQDQLLGAMDRIHMESSIKYPMDNFEIEFPETTDAAVMEQGLNMINLHYSLMAKSILAQFVDLGSNVSSTGSRSLGESQVDFFKQGLMAIARTLIEEPWNERIADLIKINFGGEIYPKLKVNPIEDKKAELIYAMLLEMTKKDAIPDVLKNRVITAGSDSLGIEVSEEELEAEAVEKKVEQEKIMKQESNMAKANQKKVQMHDMSHKHVDLEDEPMVEEYVEPTTRPLYPDEQKLKLSDIRMKLDDAKARAEFILRNKLNSEKDKIVSSFVQALREGRKAIRKVEINLAEPQNTYKEELLLLSSEIFEFGKVMSANEVGKSVPSTTKKDTIGIEERTYSIAEEQEERLRLKLSMVANDALDNNIAENDAKLILEQEYDSFWDKVLVPTIGAMIGKMFNNGRSVTFNKYAEYIFAFRYTAVLDSRTTPYCRDLDGSVLQATDPNYALITPPNHYGCRSFWTPILLSESAGVEVDGKPYGIPTYSSIDTFKDVK